MNLVQVQFVKHFSKYSPTDVAGFDAEQAKRLIDSGIAKAHESKTTAKAAAPKTKD